MSDIFQEVDEEVRREQLKKLWERNQSLIVAAVVLVLAGVGGYRGYEYWQGKRSAEAGAAFEAAVTLSEQGKHADAEAAFAKVAETSTASYRTLALLREAAELAQSDPKAAIGAYDKIAGDASVGQVLQDLAALRAGALLIDSGAFPDARTRLEPQSGAGHTFRHTARQLLALGAWQAGDTATAKRWIDIITTDAETPSDVRSQVEVLIALMAQGAG